MRRLTWLIGAGVISSLLIYTSLGLAGQPVGAGLAVAQSSTCGLAQVAFCDTFDQPSPVVSRTGQWNPILWTVANVNTTVNLDQSIINSWAATDAMHCKTPSTGVLPPNDYFMCGVEAGESEHFMEAIN